MAAPFAVERAPTVDLCCLRKYRGVHVAMLTDYPVRHPPTITLQPHQSQITQFCSDPAHLTSCSFQSNKAFALQVCGLVFEAGDLIEDLAFVVGEACQKLSAANIPHNLFVVDCGQRIFLFPNAFARAKARGSVPEDLLDTQVTHSKHCLLPCLKTRLLYLLCQIFELDVLGIKVLHW